MDVLEKLFFKWTSRAVLLLFRFFVISRLMNRGVGGGVQPDVILHLVCKFEFQNYLRAIYNYYLLYLGCWRYQ
jgi:hypothetical protein